MEIFYRGTIHPRRSPGPVLVDSLRAVFVLLAAALAPLLCVGVATAAVQTVSTTYTPYHFAASEGWRLISSGDAGQSRLEGSRLVLDFTHGAKWIGIHPPDRVILGNVSRVRIHIRGLETAHAVRLSLYTHFMTFEKALRPAAGADSIEFAAPPGPGWKWRNGENDGRMHGPLRLGDIRFEADGKKDRVRLDLVGISFEGSQPPNRLCVMTALSAGASFTAELRCLAGAPMAGGLAWTFRDWEDHKMGSGRRAITVPARGKPLRISVASPAPGNRKFIEAEFQAEIPGQQIAVVRPCWTAMQPPQTDSSLRPDSPFGMGIYLDRYHGENLERAARMARDAGVKWTREGFDWGRIEPVRGHYDWSYYDHLVATARRYGISIYGLVSGWAPWTQPYTSAGIDDYAAFLKELVRHYRTDIHQWEIWNEPNIFFWQGPKEMYAELLRRSYAAVKEADPKAQVLGMSTSGIDYNFIAQTMALGAPFDILTIHPYRKILKDRVLINEMKSVSRLVEGRPVWITEFGWTTMTPHNTLRQDFSPVSERQQAELLARAYLCILASGIRTNISWYDFRDDGNDPLYFEYEMGILHRDFTPKPAYWACATLTRVLKGQHFAGAVKTGHGNVFAYRFSGGKGTVIAVWSREAVQNLNLPVTDGATLVDTIGESRQLPRGSVRVDLQADAPIYLLLP